MHLGGSRVNGLQNCQRLKFEVQKIWHLILILHFTMLLRAHFYPFFGPPLVSQPLEPHYLIWKPLQSLNVTARIVAFFKVCYLYSEFPHDRCSSYLVSACELNDCMCKENVLDFFPLAYSCILGASTYIAKSTLIIHGESYEKWLY